MKKIIFLHYPTCTTCKKAKKWLDDHNVPYESRHIVEECPSMEELMDWTAQSELPLKKFFNTNGLAYKEMNLKDKLQDLSPEEQIQLLSTNGKLIKRPLLIGPEWTLSGFKIEEWEKIL